MKNLSTFTPFYLNILDSSCCATPHLTLASIFTPAHLIIFIFIAAFHLFQFSSLPSYSPLLPARIFSLNAHTVKWVAGSDLRLCAACGADLPSSRKRWRPLPVLLREVTIAANSLKWKTEIIQLGSDVRGLKSTFRQDSGRVWIWDVQIEKHGVHHLMALKCFYYRQKVGNKVNVFCLCICLCTHVLICLCSTTSHKPVGRF